MKVIVYVLTGIALSAGVGMVIRSPIGPIQERSGRSTLDPVPVVVRSATAGSIEMEGVGGKELMIAIGPTGQWEEFPNSGTLTVTASDHRITERLVSYPTAVPWLHPDIGQPSALVVRVAEKLGKDRIGPPRLITSVPVDHGGLPVISILVPEEAFFDPDTGIYVVGNAVLHPTSDMVRTHLEDGRWWKYPGNFHFRGKEWQRSGMVQLIGSKGKEVFRSQVGFRINGQMTRGFPMHALRLIFDTPINAPLFEDGEGRGSTILLLRTAGNDQMKALLRDELAHELCKGEPFEISRSLPCAVYVNGAYWGLHQLRQRVEEEELARRYGVEEKEIAMLEIRSDMVLGKKKQVAMFKKDLGSVLAMDPTSATFGTDVSQRFDVNGFLSYMASVMILDNKDWPDANIKFWRHTGTPSKNSPLDGRWHFILTDMDLGLGAYGTPDAPLLDRLKGHSSPMVELFNACMASAILRALFIENVERLIADRFSDERTIPALDRLISTMEPEMPRHIARWRKPNNMNAWRSEVDQVRRYLRARPEQVRSQIPELFR